MAHWRSRLLREVKDASCNADEHEIKLTPDEDNLYEWKANIRGPSDSPYEGGWFELKLTVPPTYPIAPPSVHFLTLCFHPNINFHTGELCLDVLKANWTPAWTLHSLCRAVISLLLDPNPESPLNCDAGNLLRCGDTRGFRSMARMYTLQYATSSATFSGCVQ
eukprot:GHVS01098504.1.p1 GENE.GHVS01098504.1~~GHVS01098504.1.p1  ORF type:complete len:163 (-),score=14.83 GHVS01098504.1:116-604(-)